MDITDLMVFLKKTALNAGRVIMQIYSTSIDISYKKDNSPLTVADTKANNLIIRALKARYQDIPVLSEESEDDRSRVWSDYCFIVDPLDGTKEFIKKSGEFTVNIALSNKGKIDVGVVCAPALGKIYYACKDKGAFMDDGCFEGKRIMVSPKTSGLTFVGSASHSGEKEKDLLEKHAGLITDIKSAGSSLKGCMVAQGDADIYYRFGPTCEWDTAAMQCIVEQAGGIMRQIDGSELLYNRTDCLNAKGFFIVNREENIWI